MTLCEIELFFDGNRVNNISIYLTLSAICEHILLMK